MTDTMRGQVKSLVNDKKTGKVNGLSLSGIQAFFDYSLPDYRGTPFDVAEVGAVVELGVSQKDQPASNGWPRYWVRTILRCDSPTEPPPWTEEGSPSHQQAIEHKAEAVKEVLAGEQGRNQSIERQVAMKCAAEVVAAQLAASGVYVEDENLATLIDLCLDKFLAATK